MFGRVSKGADAHGRPFWVHNRPGFPNPLDLQMGGKIR